MTVPRLTIGLRGAMAALGLLMSYGCAPEVPHPVSSQTDESCRTCHTGRAGAPAAHHKTGCVSCHEVTSNGAYPTLMPHRGGEVERCSLCHRDGTTDAAVSRHIEEKDCYTCHQAGQYGPYPPTVSHELESQDRASCLECHTTLGHSERVGCLDCHGT